MPHMDDIRCKHCNALLGMMVRAAIKNKFGAECPVCKVVTIVWPLERQALIIKVNEYQPSQ